MPNIVTDPPEKKIIHKADIITRRHTPTLEEKDQREYDLSVILTELKESHKEFKDKTVITMMKQSYPDYDRFKLYKDQRALNQKNTFIRDLTEANVSKFYEDLWGRLDTLSRDAAEFYNSLSVERKNSKEGRAVGYYIKNIIEQQDALMKGPMMNISNALGMRKIGQLEQEKERLYNMMVKNGIDPESGEKILEKKPDILQEDKA